MRTAIRTKTKTRRQPRTGRRSNSAPKKPAAASAASRTSSHMPDSPAAVSSPGYSATSRSTSFLAHSAEDDERDTDDRDPSQPAYGVPVRPNDCPEGANPGEQDVAEVDHKPNGRGENAQGLRDSPEASYYLSAPGDRTAPALWTGRTGSGSGSGTAGPRRLRRPFWPAGAGGRSATARSCR